MAEFKFFCPQCGQRIQCDTGYVGTQINCPICQQAIVVPQVPGAGAPPPNPAAGRQFSGAPVAPPPAAKTRVRQNLLVAAGVVLVLAGLGVGGWYGYAKLKRGHLPAGLVALWSGEGNGNDSAGTNKGTLVGGVGFTNGKVGQAFNFNGTDSYVNVPSSPGIKITGPFTVEAWINYSRTSNNGNASVMVVDKGADVNSSVDWGLGISPAKKLRPHAQIGSSWVYFDCASTLNTGIWYHVAMVYNGTYIQGYVNGVLDGSQPVSGMLQATDYPLRIGAYSSVAAGFFPGQVDELSLYNRALSADEIRQRFNAGNSGAR